MAATPIRAGAQRRVSRVPATISSRDTRPASSTVLAKACACRVPAANRLRANYATAAFPLAAGAGVTVKDAVSAFRKAGVPADTSSMGSR